MSELRRTFISGIVWGTVEKFSTLFVGFIVTLLLARELTPEDYGLVNMISIFTVFGLVLVDAGFGQALIQKRDATDKDYSSVFYLNIVLSALIYSALYCAAPLIADFYSQPALVDISRALFLLFPINALSIIQHTILTKEMRVRDLTIVSVASSIGSGVVGVWLAVKGTGVWALVFQTLVMYGVRCVVLWMVNSWRPILAFSISSVRSILNFSMNLLGTFTLAAIFQNIYAVIIGKMFNAEVTGYYNQAYRLESIVTGTTTSAVQRVSFPAFATIQNEPDRLREVYRKVIGVTMFIHLPVIAGVASIGPDMFLVLLTEKWLPSVPLFYLLCAASALYPMHMVNANVIKALGKGKTYFRLSLLKYSLMTLFIVLTLGRSVYLVLGGYVAATLISSLVITYFCGKSINYPLLSQCRDLFPVFAVTAVMVAVVVACGCLPVNPALRLVIEIASGTAVYILLSLIFRLKAMSDLMNVIKNENTGCC